MPIPWRQEGMTRSRPFYQRSCKQQSSQLLKKKAIEKKQKQATEHQSAIARHLLTNEDCALAYHDNSFRVLCMCPSEYCIDVLEALFIRSLAPSLCVQKTTVTSLKLFRPDIAPSVRMYN